MGYRRLAMPVRARALASADASSTHGAGTCPAIIMSPAQGRERRQRSREAQGRTDALCRTSLLVGEPSQLLFGLIQIRLDNVNVVPRSLPEACGYRRRGLC